MTRPEKFREPLSDKWRDALIGESGLKDLREAKETLARVIASLQGALRKNPLTRPAAEAAAKELQKSGDSTVVVDPEGLFWLETVDLMQGGDKRPWKTQLPTLKELRKEAASLGVDTQLMGRSKTDILKAIKIARRNASEQEASILPPGTPKRRMVRTFTALKPVLMHTDPNVT